MHFFNAYLMLQGCGHFLKSYLSKGLNRRFPSTCPDLKKKSHDGKYEGLVFFYY